MAKDDVNGGGPQPRICHVVKVDTFDGYGFNLLAEQGRPGQFIGKVDEGSPAETAGLRQGDRILQVNGVSIEDDNHKQVVQKIKAIPGETKLLVVTPSPEERPPAEKAKEPPKAAQPEAQTHLQLQPQPAGDKLNLGMTAAEMRARLAAKKKTDPKSAKMDFKSKFDLVQKL